MAMEVDGASSVASPSMQMTKRRHTSISGSHSGQSAEKRLKRSKTLKTYGKMRSIYDFEDDGPEDGDELSTVHSAQRQVFGTSGRLPSGSFQNDTLNHEPVVMFHESGSTAADTSSEQKRLLVKAIGEHLGSDAVPMKKSPFQEQSQHSSSIPWTESVSTNSTRSTEKSTTKQMQRPSPLVLVEGTSVADDIEADVDGDNSVTNGTSTTIGDVASGVDDLSAALRDTPQAPQPSPTVEIVSLKGHGTVKSRQSSPAPPQSTRGLKRKAQADPESEPLNSDDKAIGLPKERYQPRPSRRRATQIPDEPVDLSVRPEKAGKVKRTKTTHVASTVPAAKPEASERISHGAVRTEVQAEEKSPNSSVHDSNNTEHGGELGDQGCDSKVVENAEDAVEVLRMQANEGALPKTSQKTDDEIFVKPAMPAPKAKAGKKSRRSHTTIFEDHVDFTGSQRAPTLREQQATRKATLQDVQNEAAVMPRKRKTIVPDEEDDEQASATALTGTAEVEKSPLQVSGRGRPSKDTSKRDSSLDHDTGFVSLAVDAENNHEAEEAPKKPGRGRPRKASKQALPEASSDVPSNVVAEPTDPTADSTLTSEKSPSTHHSQQTATESPPNNPITMSNIPTPSPEKLPEKSIKPAATPTKPATGPTSHSPIKSSLKVPLRVGLSNRSRIPSLLRVMRPPKR